MTRLFRHGRTETVRSLSEGTAAFVRALDGGESDEAVWALLQTAAAEHAIKNKVRVMTLVCRPLPDQSTTQISHVSTVFLRMQ